YTRHLLTAEPKGHPPVSDEKAQTIMRGDDVKVWFPIKQGFMRRTVDHVKAVDGIDLTVRAGQPLGVVGEWGSGRPTLGLAVARINASEWRIIFAGCEIDAHSFKEIRPIQRELQFVFQDPFGSLGPRMTIAELIEEGLRFHDPKLTADERDDRVVDVMKEV